MDQNSQRPVTLADLASKLKGWAGIRVQTVDDNHIIADANRRTFKFTVGRDRTVPFIYAELCLPWTNLATCSVHRMVFYSVEDLYAGLCCIGTFGAWI